MGKQTCLEKTGLQRRQEELVRNDYTRFDEYSAIHKDAISDGDPQGKGSGHGGHTHSVPNCDLPKGMMDYSNFDTNAENIGGSYDIHGRNGVGGREFLSTINIYNESNSYGINSVDTTANVEDGQIVIK